MESRIQLTGEIDYNDTRREGVAVAQIGQDGQLILHLLLWAETNCAVNLRRTKEKQVSEEILDRLAGRDDGMLVGAVSLRANDQIEYSKLIAPVKVMVIGEDGGKLHYVANVEEIE